MKRFNLTYALESHSPEIQLDSREEQMIYRGLDAAIESIVALTDLGFKRNKITGSLESHYQTVSTEGFISTVRDMWRRLIEWFKELFSSDSTAAIDSSIAKIEEKEKKIPDSIPKEDIPLLEEKILSSGLARRINSAAYLPIFGTYKPAARDVGADKKLARKMEDAIAAFSTAANAFAKATNLDALAAANKQIDASNEYLASAADAIMGSVVNLIELSDEQPENEKKATAIFLRHLFKPTSKVTTEETAKALAEIYSDKPKIQAMSARVKNLHKSNVSMGKSVTSKMIPAVEKMLNSKFMEEMGANDMGELMAAKNRLDGFISTLIKISNNSVKLHERLIGLVREV